jgi:hypothetical protein
MTDDSGGGRLAEGADSGWEPAGGAGTKKEESTGIM